MRPLRAVDRQAAPWKNGGGVTREVAAWPPGAGLDDFDWRVSTADIASDGPFSIFPDVDRVLAVLEGRFHLSIAGHEAAELGVGSAPIAFPGDVPATAVRQTPLVRDLNVMVRRGRITTQVTPLILAVAHVVPLAGAHTLLFVAEGALRIGPDGLALVRGDALLVEGAPQFSLAVTAGSARAFCVNFHEA